MKDLCGRAGVKHFGFHALRRYVASILRDEADSINMIDRYAHNNFSDLVGTLELLSIPWTPPNEGRNTPRNTPTKQKGLTMIGQPLAV